MSSEGKAKNHDNPGHKRFYARDGEKRQKKLDDGGEAN
jgi:hypothetical protein